MQKTYYHYEDVFLIPNKSSIQSRSLIDTSVKLGPQTFKVPIIPSNMVCTINEWHSRHLQENSVFYVMHRFDVNILKFVKEIQNWKTISISVGVQDTDKQLISNIKQEKLRVDYITIDVAHGHHQLVIDMIRYIRLNLPDVYIIAGNIVTFQALVDLIKAGANSCKVGIGQGKSCSTKTKTGFTMPMFSCLQNLKEQIKEARGSDWNMNHLLTGVTIIADGGIRCNGDIAKAINAGATMVMAGSMFAKLTDSPAKPVFDGDMYVTHKRYYGSASIYNKKTKKNIEGTLELLPVENTTYLEKINEIQQDLQSAISYAGGTKLHDLVYCDWGIQQ